MILKKKNIVLIVALVLALLVMGFGCPLTENSFLDVVFQSAVQTGGASGTADSTALTLTFDIDPTTLAADDITVTGATKGALSGSGTTRTLVISGITVGNGETISVAIASPEGFIISGSPQAAVVYKDTRIAAAFQSAVQTGGASGTADSTGLTLTFDVDPTTLAADDITVTGATKGALSGSGTTRTLVISGITVGNGETISVAIASPEGFIISGSPQAAVVYRALSIGVAYQGGIIAYVLQSGDPGYVSGETHGLIAATADQSTGIQWWNGIEIRTSAIGIELGTGQANTTAIILKQGTGNYAAQLCDAYTNADMGTGVYSDWYLPSKDELNKLYLNRTAVGGFSVNMYWSSTETYNGVNVWSQYFFDGNTRSTYYRANVAHVRAVRAF